MDRLSTEEMSCNWPCYNLLWIVDLLKQAKRSKLKEAADTIMKDQIIQT